MSCAGIPPASACAQSWDARLSAPLSGRWVTQVALLYAARLRAGLQARQVFEDDLVGAAAWPGAALGSLPGRFVFVDWGQRLGPELVHAHTDSMAELIHPGLTLALGTLTGEF